MVNPGSTLLYIDARSQDGGVVHGCDGSGGAEGWNAGYVVIQLAGGWGY